VWAFDRTRNDTPADEEAWISHVHEAVAAGLDLTPEQVIIKRRFRQQDRQTGDGQYHRLDHTGHARIVTEHGLRFEINLSDYLDTGLFLDHRPTRQRVRSEAKDKRVLNLFAYTGAFTVHAIAGGASRTTTVDLSNTYVDWAIRNLTLNDMAVGEQHAMIRADCLQWLEKSTQDRTRYDLIICDPPTFSNSKSMTKTFRIDHDHPWLIKHCTELLSPGGVLYFSTNFRGFKLNTDELPPLQVTDISSTSVPEDFRNRKIHQCWRMVKE
jgi:23S rRNA (cytosine1962-C5)-methyltransferase